MGNYWDLTDDQAWYLDDLFHRGPFKVAEDDWAIVRALKQRDYVNVNPDTDVAEIASGAKEAIEA